jgi:hypothetical protein
MGATVDQLADVVVHETAKCFDDCLAKIRHCLDQLSDEQVWWRPDNEMNAIGNLLLHLTGNVRQWIVAGLGNAPDIRQRPREFAERGPIPKARLLADLEAVVGDAKAALSRCRPDDLLAHRRIQGFDVTGLGAIFDSVPHFKGHTQEIICLTRLQLGPQYQFHWKPQTAEQGI